MDDKLSERINHLPSHVALVLQSCIHGYVSRPVWAQKLRCRLCRILRMRQGRVSLLVKEQMHTAYEAVTGQRVVRRSSNLAPGWPLR